LKVNCRLVDSGYCR